MAVSRPGGFVFFSLCYLALRSVLQFAALRVRSTDFKALEIVVLRHDLAILRRRSRRPRMTWTDRIFLAAAGQLLRRTRWRSFTIITGAVVQRSLMGIRSLVSRSLAEWSIETKPSRRGLGAVAVCRAVLFADRGF